jgi:hypothetical protein
VFVEKVKADHRDEWSAYISARSSDVTEDQQEDKALTAKIAKKVADAILTLRPRVLVSASEEVFDHHLLRRLRGKFSQGEEHASLDTLCLDAKRSGARTIILVNPVAIDYGEASRRTGCFVLPIFCGRPA